MFGLVFRIVLLVCLAGVCYPQDASKFFFDDISELDTDGKGNTVIGVFPGPHTHTSDLCTALKDGMDVFVKAGAMSCEDLPERFPENIRSYCMFSGAQLFKSCSVADGVDNAAHCIKDFTKSLSASPPLEACTCHALRDSLVSIFSLAYLHCTATLQEATEALYQKRGGRDLGDYVLGVTVTNERLLHSFGVDFNKTGGWEKSNFTGFVEQILNWELLKEGSPTETPLSHKGTTIAPDTTTTTTAAP